MVKKRKVLSSQPTPPHRPAKVHAPPPARRLEPAASARGEPPGDLGRQALDLGEIGRLEAREVLAHGRLDVGDAREPDGLPLPLGDLGLRKAVERAYARRGLDPRRLERLAERWRPWRTVATWYLWRSLDAPA